MKISWGNRVFRFILVLALIIASISVSPVSGIDKAFAEELPLRDQVIGDFETDGEGWTFYNGAEFSGGQGAFVRDDADFHSGAYSGKLTGDFTDGGNYVALKRSVAPIDVRELSFWIKTSDLGIITLRIVDSTGQVHQQRVPLQQTSDWQQVKITDFAGGQNYTHWGGANDGVWHGPAREIWFILEKARIINGEKIGQLWLDDIIMRFPMPPLEIEQVTLGNVFQKGQGPAEFRILTQGDTIAWSVYDYWGKIVAEQTEAVETGSKTVQLPQLGVGYYIFKIAAFRGGNQIGAAENTFAVLSPNDWRQVADSPFGMQTHFVSRWDPDMIPLLEQAGVKSVRDEMYWNRVEPQKGVYEFPESFDRYMSELQAHHINPFIIYSYTNPNYDNNSTPYTDEGRRGFAEYGRQILEQYDNIKWVEVYNEFNLLGAGDRGDGPADSKPEYYFELLKETYETVKASHPDVTVVGPTAGNIPHQWLEELFTLGGLGYLDAVSVHPYRYPSPPEGLAQATADLRNLIARYNGDQQKPIWFTEIGWPTQKDVRGVSEDTQAEYLVRAYAIALSQGVERLFWYDFMNDGLDETYNEHNFGIIRNPGDPKGRYAPKPAYVAYATMTRQLTGAEFSRKEDVGDDIHSYVFNASGTDIRVIWSANAVKQIKIKTQVPVEVVDLMGEQQTLYPTIGDYVYLTISGSPVYIRGNIKEVSEGSKFALTAYQGVSGDPIQAVLTVDNTIPPKGRIKAEINIDGAVQEFDVMPGKVQELEINLPAEDTPGTKTLYGIIRENGQPVARVMTEVKIIDPVQLQVKHILQEDEDVLKATVNNLSLQHEYDMDHINWQVGNQSGTVETQFTVQPGQTQSVFIPVPEMPADQTYPVVLSIYDAGGQSVLYNGNIRLISITDMKSSTQTTIDVDGVFDDLSGASSIDLSEGTVKISDYFGAEDLSGQIWLTWDQDNLYISAKTHDDVFYQPATGDSIWQGDSIQFAVSQGMPGESKEWYEYGTALTEDGAQVYRWIAPADKKTGLVNDVQCRITRDENAKDTIYELALPWSGLQPCELEDGMLSFSILVNDNDGQGRKGWIEWGAGIGGSKDSKLFKPVYLDK